MFKCLFLLTAAALSQPDGADSGVLSRNDVPAIAEADFGAADANADGALTEEEYVTAMSRPAVLAAPDGAMDGGELSDPEMEDRLRLRFGRISGGDGVLTLEELEAALLDDFDAADANGDGVLDQGEIDQFAAARRGATMM